MRRGKGKSRGGGLSPRVRGNHKPGRDRKKDRGSIPACTGEPHAQYPDAATPSVYPRVYGGTEDEDEESIYISGLSPRVRGNLFQSTEDGHYSRSIPACTGEPALKTTLPLSATVYPRVYGGTVHTGKLHLVGMGLSPRVRGNLASALHPRAHGGSIPACTGEPSAYPRGPYCRPVYPRVYGGTSIHAKNGRMARGLSPRVRGNLTERDKAFSEQRSIPACTGEPEGDIIVYEDERVYPRVYGGTGCKPASAKEITGLSPRVRGNQSTVP